MGTTTYKLSNYINKIESLYGTARGAYSKTVEELNDLEEKHKANLKSGELSSIGVNKENERYYTRKQELLNAIGEIRNEFMADVQKVRDSVDTLFRNNYRVNSESLDTGIVEIVKSGMLTDSELLELANKYKAENNLTMYRFVGSSIKNGENSDNQAIRQLAIDSHRMRQREDLITIDAFADFCLAGLRDNKLLADGVDKAHEEFFVDTYNTAKNITATVSTPWDD